MMTSPDVVAFLVVYQWCGEQAKYVTLDRPAAEKFAVRYNGVVVPLISKPIE